MSIDRDRLIVTLDDIEDGQSPQALGPVDGCVEQLPAHTALPNVPGHEQDRNIRELGGAQHLLEEGRDLVTADRADGYMADRSTGLFGDPGCFFGAPDEELLDGEGQRPPQGVRRRGLLLGQHLDQLREVGTPSVPDQDVAAGRGHMARYSAAVWVAHPND